MKSFTVPYGASELKRVYQQYITDGLLIAAFFHLFFIGGYRLYEYIGHNEIVFPKTLPTRTVEVIPLPPPISDRPFIPRITTSALPSIQRGAPIPVPDPEINPEMTLATQEQMNENPESLINSSNENGTSYSLSEGTILNNNEEKEPPPFQPVQKEPLPVHRVFPPYPEIARRSGVEGIVFVRMWVTKKGRVKKAVIDKTTSDLFNQAALDAANQWTFIPAIMNNGPVSVWVTVPFKFRLSK